MNKKKKKGGGCPALVSGGRNGSRKKAIIIHVSKKKTPKNASQKYKVRAPGTSASCQLKSVAQCVTGFWSSGSASRAVDNYAIV